MFPAASRATTTSVRSRSIRGPIGRGKATATVEGTLAARGTLTFAVER